MLTLDFSNLFKVSSEHGLSQSDLDEQTAKIQPFLDQIHLRKQGFEEILDDQETIEKIKSFANENREKYEDVVVLGIGGSALGAICLQQSLYEKEGAKNSPGLHVLDNIDPDLISAVEKTIDYEKTLFIVISKSGSTVETLAQYEYFKQKGKHFVFVTDPEVGRLRELANAQEIPTFDIPQNLGGRFSVLSAVGLLPAALIGIDIDQLVEGAKIQRANYLSGNQTENQAFQLAATQHLLYLKEKKIAVLFPYSQHLIRLTDWYRQLLAESIGKKLDNQGQTINVGITPVSALGATDQHSQAQLFNEGPNDKLIIFIETEKHKTDLKIPNHPLTFAELLKIEKNSTETAFTENDRPNLTIRIPEISAHTIGELLFFFEASIAFLGEFFNINAFDQPGVELSKKLTRAELEKLS